MQFDEVKSLPPPVRPRPARTRLVGMGNGKTDTPAPQNIFVEDTPASSGDISMQPTLSMQKVASRDKKPLLVTPPIRMNGKETTNPSDFDISSQSTVHLMQLSGMLPAVRLPRQEEPVKFQSSQDNSAYDEEGYWPFGIQQTGALPVINLYGREPFGRTLPQTPTVILAVPGQQAKQQPAWKAILGTPAVKVAMGLIIGIGLLLLVALFVDLPATIQILRQSLTTPRGIALALLSGVAFLLAWSIRGVRWRLFLNPVGKVSTIKAIQLYMVGVFLNFLLPVRGGEVAKSLMLKRSSGIPVSKSLPTVAMDKALDLMPALFIMAIVPLLGVQMDIKLWLVLAFVGGILVSLMFFVLLAAWKRNAAIGLLQKLTGLFPKAISGKIEGFATGFVDSLLMGASQPRIFIPAILLTCVAVVFDGLFAMLAFWTIGSPIPFGTAIFGYTVYNMFYILPTPPGQVGSNEAVGLLVFTGLLHLSKSDVFSMFVFSHPWAALLMCSTGLACLSALGLTISSAMKVQTGGESEEPPVATRKQKAAARA